MVTVLGNTKNLSKNGYAFVCWNTRADGYGTDYKPGETFIISANTNFYAIWKRNDGSVREDYISNLYTDFNVTVKEKSEELATVGLLEESIMPTGRVITENMILSEHGYATRIKY